VKKLSRFLISVDLSIDPNFGFVKALRIANSCSPKKIVSDSLSLFIHMDFEVEDPETVFKCVEQFVGLASIDIKLCLWVPPEADLRKALRKTSFRPVPKAMSDRVAGYRNVGDGIVVIEETSRKGLYVARYLAARSLPIPIPSSTYIVHGYAKQVVETCRERASKLLREIESLVSMLRSMGIAAEIVCRGERSTSAST